MKLSPKLEAFLLALLWLALTGLALVMAYIIGSVIVWLVQQAIIAIWPIIKTIKTMFNTRVFCLIISIPSFNHSRDISNS